MTDPDQISIYVVIVQDIYYPSGDDGDWKMVTTSYDTAIGHARRNAPSDYGWASVVRISLPDSDHVVVWTSEKDS